MKLNKTIGRVATTLVATAMLASLAAVPAFAEDDTANLVGAATAEVPITKYIAKPANVYAPNATFEFTVAEVGTIAYAKDQSFNTAVKFEHPADGNVHKTKITSTANASDIDATDPVEAGSETLLIDATKFAEPGVYHFTITEAAGSYENDNNSETEDEIFGWAEQTLNLTVYITNESTGMQVKAYALTKGEDKTEKQSAFTNDYMQNTSGDPHTFSLVKVVDGNAATSVEKAAHFSFNVTINNASTSVNKNYYLVVDHKGDGYNDEHDGKFMVTEGTATTISVSATDAVTIYGLSTNDKVTITETNYAGNNKPTGACEWSEFVVTNSATETAGEQLTASNMSVTATDANNKVTFTNTHTIANPTGIVMDIAPYALLVVIAAAGCFVFLRKRRED